MFYESIISFKCLKKKYSYIVCSSWTEIHLDECVLNKDFIQIRNKLGKLFLKNKL
jgi:hypothetical protein